MNKNPLLILIPVLFFPFKIWSQEFPNDCVNALLLCTTSPIAIQALDGPGKDSTEVGVPSCLDANFPESNSVWFRWTVESAGALEFTLIPLDEQDDLDFVLYRLEGGLKQCDKRKEMRCLVHGPALGSLQPKAQDCTGATGLKAGTPASAFGEGCPDGDGNFLAPVSVEAGESYLLFVNNFRSANGFLLEFSGSCTFREIPGPCNNSQVPVLENGQDALFAVSGVMPNPSADVSHINLHTSRLVSGQLIIIDVQGRVRQVQPLDLLPGEHKLILDVANLEQGVYFVKIRLDGQAVYLERFFKH